MNVSYNARLEVSLKFPEYLTAFFDVLLEKRFLRVIIYASEKEKTFDFRPYSHEGIGLTVQAGRSPSYDVTSRRNVILGTFEMLGKDLNFIFFDFLCK